MDLHLDIIYLHIKHAHRTDYLPFVTEKRKSINIPFSSRVGRYEFDNSFLCPNTNTVSHFDSARFQKYVHLVL